MRRCRPSPRPVARPQRRLSAARPVGAGWGAAARVGAGLGGARQLARRHGSSSSTQEVLAKYGHQQARNPRPAADRPPVWAATNAGAKTKPPRYSEKQKMGWLAFGVLAPCCFVYSMWQGAQVINEIKRRRGVTEQEAAEPDFLASLAQDDGEAQEPQEVAEDPAAAQARAAAIARLEMQRAAVRQQRERLEAEIAELNAESAAARRDIGAETPAAAAAAASTAAAPEARGGAAPAAMDGSQPRPPTLGSRLASPPLRPRPVARTGDFLPCETFKGEVLGAEFKRGPRGMGYYRTQEAKERLAAVEAMAKAEEEAAVAAAMEDVRRRLTPKPTPSAGGGE